ncbi:Na(+)/H(+) antiporter subunit D [bacterium]|jgi:multicomponent Na+:H+ antiporter subunit D|nr:Na(+)/H(+) antiporter subunit D [bacterium]
MIASEIPPSLLLMGGSLLVPLFRGWWKKFYLLALPVIALWGFLQLEPGNYWEFTFLQIPIVLGHVDKLSTAFGIIFLLISFIGVLYILHQKDNLEFVAGLFYAGSAVGAILAGDLFSFLVFWEMLTLGSMFLILARKTPESTKAAFRYVLMHVFGGLLLISGIILRIHETGSFEFGQIGLSSLSTYLIFFGMGVNCAWPFLHTWLVDSYPSSSLGGAVFLSSFTTKTAVYALARAFPGEHLLIWIGVGMAAFPIFYAVIENNLRKVLAYSLLNQLGFMVTGIGIGTPLALNGAVAHAFCHILYKGLLWMSMGAVLYRTGRTKCTELGGLYKSMPWTCLFCVIGAMSISAFPLTNGFVSKSLIMSASLEEHLYLVWFVLLFAAAGVFHHAGIKIPFFAFFSHDRGLRTREAPGNMLAAMGIAGFLCIFLGCYPDPLYALLPNAVEYQPYTYDHFISQAQLLFFSALAFSLLMLAGLYPAEIRSVNLDFEWVYRKSARGFYRLMDLLLNGINSVTDRILAREFTSWISALFKNFPGLVSTKILSVGWLISGVSSIEMQSKKAAMMARFENGTVSIGFSAIAALFVLCWLIGW